MSIDLHQAEGGNIMAQQTFEKKLRNMKAMLDMTQQFFKQVMVKDQDYGVIPGTDKPGLLKPGAEKLCELYGYAATINHIDEVKDRETGYYEATVYIEIVERRSGMLVGHGVGSANNYESKYRYRWVSDKKLPRDIDPKTLKSQVRNGKYGEYVVYRLENDDLYSQWNTILKMAKKRALVDAVLQCTQSSGIFAQGEDELAEWVDAAVEMEPEPPSTPAVKVKEQISPEQHDLIWRKSERFEKDLTKRAAWLKSTYGLDVAKKQGRWAISCTYERAHEVIADLVAKEKAETSKKEPSKSELDFTNFWSSVKNLRLTEKDVHKHAAAYFNVPELKSLKEIPDLDQAGLGKFLLHLRELVGA